MSTTLMGILMGKIRRFEAKQRKDTYFRVNLDASRIERMRVQDSSDGAGDQPKLFERSSPARSTASWRRLASRSLCSSTVRAWKSSATSSARWSL